MLYKFKSPVAGDVIMLGPQGDQMLKLMGREPAAQGIIEPEAMGAVLAALQAAIDAETPASAEAAEDEPGKPGVGLRQRLWPMIEMLRRSQAAGKPVVWGV
jgi:hypothetical protein